MSPAGDRLVLLLPERRRFAGQASDPAFAAAIGRGDRLADAVAGEAAQLQRHFAVEPHGWPLAAITRAAEHGDAAGHAWLRADPAFVRAEMAGVRLMACGDLAMPPDEAEAFLAALRPLFDDEGMPLSAGGAGRWYLRVPRDLPIPEFTPPSEALGADVFAFLPAGPQGRRWRTLANEAQVVLHNHPRNAARIDAGLPPVNSLWFWGGGPLPDFVRAAAHAVATEDFELGALAAAAGARSTPGGEGSVLLDLRRERDWPRVQARILADGVAQLGTRFVEVRLDFADGAGVVLTAGQRWRVWRRAVDVRATEPIRR